MVTKEEDIALPLVRRSSRPPRREVDLDAAELTELEAKLTRSSLGDRLRPSSAGGLTGALGGLAAFGCVALVDRSLAMRAFQGLAHRAGVPVEPTAMALVLAIAALVGAVVGALFAKLTSRLRRWLPLVTWSLIAFPSLVVALLAVQRTYLPRASFLGLKPLLAASVAFALVWSLAVILRVRTLHVTER